MTAGMLDEPGGAGVVRKPARRAALSLLLLLLGYWAADAMLMPHPELALPVRVRLAGIGEHLQSGEWVRQLKVTLPAPEIRRMTNMEVTVGTRLFTFPRATVLSTWLVAGEEGGSGTPLFTLTAPAEVRGEPSLLPWRAGLVNWPGDAAVLRSRFPAGLAMALLAVLACLLIPRLDSRRRDELWVRRALLPAPPHEPAEPGSATGWLAFGALVLASALVLVETLQPVYFTQDDAFAAELPHLLQGCRSAFAGVFPEWNPFEYAGAPSASLGIWGLLYPPTYLAYALARWVLGNEFLSLEVLAVIHLTAGFLAMYWASRVLGMRPALAVVAGLSLVLSGTVLIMGRSWHQFLPIVVWMPLLVGLTAAGTRGPVGWRWAGATGASIGMLYHSGFAPLWGWAMVFQALTVLALIMGGALSGRRALWHVPALLLGAALAAPLVATQYAFTRGMVPDERYGEGVLRGLASFLLPYPLANAPHPELWGATAPGFLTMNEFYYSGTLLCATAALALVAIAGYRSAQDRRLVQANVWLLLAAVALVLALGDEGLLWPLVGHVPLPGMSHYPFRLLPFVHLFALLGGGVILERLLGHAARPALWERGIFIGVGALLLYHCFFCQSAFYLYGEKPYAQLPPEAAALLRADGTATPGRVLGIAPPRWAGDRYSVSMLHGFPSVHGVLSFDGYDPITILKGETVEARERLSRDPVATARAYGIRWLVFHRSIAGTGAGRMFEERTLTFEPEAPALRAASLPRYSDPDIEIRELAGADPMAFWETDRGRALPVRFDGSGVQVVTAPGRGGGLVVNVMAWPGMAAETAGRRLEVAADGYRRVRIDVPPGTAGVKVRYRPPWGAGLLAGCFLGAMAVLSALGARALNRTPGA